MTTAQHTSDTPAPYACPARTYLLTDAARLHGVMQGVFLSRWADPALATDRHVTATIDMLREELTRALDGLEDVR